MEDQLTSPRPQTSVLEIFEDSCILQTQYDNYDYDAPESRWSRQGTLATCQIEEGISDLHELFEKILCIPAISAPVERVFGTSGLSMQPLSARVGNELLSELVMIKVTSCNCRRMFHWQWRQWQFIDSDDVVLVRTIKIISVWWKLMSLITCFYISCRQKCLKFESWFFVHEESVLPWLQHYPAMGSVVLGDWLTEWLTLAQCFTLRDFITFVLTSYACRLLVTHWYEPRGIVDTRDTCAVSRYFLLPRYTAVYRDFGDTGIVT